MEIEPFSLSRQIEQIDERYRVWQAALVQGAALVDPFRGETFPGKSIYDAAEHLPADDLIREGLLPWLHRLIDLRIQVPWTLLDADLEYRTLQPLSVPVDEVISLAEVRRRAFVAPVELAEAYYRVLPQLERRLSAHRVQLWARRVEVAARLGLADQHLLRDPVSEPGVLRTIGRRLLKETADAAEEQIGHGWTALVEATAARDAVDGWPARLSADALRALLGRQELFRSVQLRVPRLPARLCPASFPRAAAEIGKALSGALAPRDIPFVLARHPDDLLGHRTAALFYLWSTSAPFFRRTLGLSRVAARQHAMIFRRATLGTLRLAAVRHGVARAAVEDKKSLLEVHASMTEDLLGSPLPDHSVLVRFRVHADQGARFAAWLSALSDVETYVGRYDEDFYENPRFQEEFRAELSRRAETSVSAAHCEAGLSAFLRQAV